MALTMQDFVYMYFSGGSWFVQEPSGTMLSTTGTTTSGLQEAINYATTNSYNLLIEGAPTKSSGTSLADLPCTTAVSFPPMNNIIIQARGVQVNFASSYKGDGFFMDSMNNCVIDWQGTINYGGNNYAVHIRPGSAVPAGGIGICKSQIKFGDIISYEAGTLTQVCLDIGQPNGVIVQNYFEFQELKGGVPWTSLYNFLVTGGGTGSVFRYNELRIGSMLHANSAALYNACTTLPGNDHIQSRNSNNVWHLNGVSPYALTTPSVTSPIGVFSNSLYDVYIIGSVTDSEGQFTNAVQFNGDAAGNLVICGQSLGANGANFVDQGFGNRFVTSQAFYNEVPVVDGFSVTIPGTSEMHTILKGSGTFTSGMVIFPTGLVDGQCFRISSIVSVPSMTFSSSQTIHYTPSLITVGPSIGWRYVLADNAWYPL